MPIDLRVGRRAWREVARGLYAEDAVISLSSALCARQSGSVMGSLSGTHAEKFAQMRLLYLFMICLPGKKLTFMGTELGQLTSANLPEGVEWFFRQATSHAELFDFVKSLNAYYLQTPPLWECDCSKDGLAGVECKDAPTGVIAFKRFDRVGREVCAVFNMTDQKVRDIRLMTGGRYPYYEAAFSTDPSVSPNRLQTDGQGSVTMDLDPLCGVILTPLAPTGGFWFDLQENM